MSEQEDRYEPPRVADYDALDLLVAIERLRAALREASEALDVAGSQLAASRAHQEAIRRLPGERSQ